MKMCEQILKKDSATIQFKFVELKKNHDVRTNSRYRFAAVNNKNNKIFSDLF